MSDLTLEAIKAWKLTWTPYRVTDAGTCLEWQGRADRCRILVDPVAHAYLVQSGKDTDALVAEVERLRAVEAAALDWDTADRGLEAMPCRDAAELLHRRRLAVHALRLALHPQEPSDE